MSSQRHKLWEYGAASNGEVHAQGVTAVSIINQMADDPSNLNVLKGREVPASWGTSELNVPEGPRGGPLSGSSMTGAIPESVQPDPSPPDPDIPDITTKPVLNSINPNSAHLGDEDLTMNVNGSKFVDGSVIVFNNGDETTTFISNLKLSTTVKPSTATTAGSFPVWVRNPDGQRTDAQKMFTFVDPNLVRDLPVGPLVITLIEEQADGIQITLAEGDVHVGDTVLIEATSNTNINGSYQVLLASGTTIVVDNNYVLTAPIEAKGRLTVTAEAT